MNGTQLSRIFIYKTALVLNETNTVHKTVKAGTLWSAHN